MDDQYFNITESGLYDDPADILERAEARAEDELQDTPHQPSDVRRRVASIYQQGAWT
ncbi:MAG: hypothetical protein ACPHVN_00785 [Luminiphilus sp.]